MRIPVIRGTAGPGRQFSGVIFIDTGTWLDPAPPGGVTSAPRFVRGK
jgi:hypothetical protein